MGFVYLMQNLAQERLGIAVQAVASAESVLEQTLAYVKERTAFGNPIGSFQNSKFLLADLHTQVRTSRVLLDWALDLHLRKELNPADASMVKLQTTEMQMHVIDRCLQLHGGYGYMTEYPVARAFADARIQSIYGGTSEIMREIIGRSLGL
jgi:long-chain-acyl-CoA dehydrogenase